MGQTREGEAHGVLATGRGGTAARGRGAGAHDGPVKTAIAAHEEADSGGKLPDGVASPERGELKREMHRLGAKAGLYASHVSEPLGGRGASLRASMYLHPCGEVTDSDPFFFTNLPVLRPRPLASASRSEEAAHTATALNRFLLEAARKFGGPSKAGPKTLLVSKWTGTFVPLPSFTRLTGMAGASVASSGLFGGLARLIGLEFLEEPNGDLARKLDRALRTLESGEAEFVHVHTKVADEAAHAGDPALKVEVIEGLDRGMAALLELPPGRLALCMTSDHCTPVGGRTVHWGDSVPLVVRGPYVRVDGVDRYDERSAAQGGLGQLGAGDVLPYLLCQADRARFKGARPTPEEVLGIPRSGEEWAGP